MTDDIDHRMELQTREFNALDVLVTKYKALCATAIVDDDYPEVRHYYESALKDFIHALQKNGRIK